MINSLFGILYNEMGFLFDTGLFKTIHVELFPYGQGGALTIINEKLTICLSIEKDKTELGLKKTFVSEHNPDYYGIAVIQEFFGNKKFDSSEYDYKHAIFLQQRLVEIIDLFTDEKYDESKQKLDSVSDQRSRRLNPRWYK